MSTLHEIWTELKAAWSSDAQKKHTQEAIPVLRNYVASRSGTYTDRAYKETYQAMQAMRWYFGNDEKFASYLTELQKTHPTLYNWIEFSAYQTVEQQLPEERRKARIERKQFDDSSYGVGKAAALATVLLAAGLAGCVNAESPVTTPSPTGLYPINYTPTQTSPAPVVTPSQVHPTPIVTQAPIEDVPAAPIPEYVPIPPVDIAKNNTNERDAIQLPGFLLADKSEVLNTTDELARVYKEKGVLAKELPDGKVLFYGNRADQDQDEIPDWMEERVLHTNPNYRNMIMHVYVMEGLEYDKKAIYAVRDYWNRTNFNGQGIDAEVKFIPIPHESLRQEEWKNISKEGRMTNTGIRGAQVITKNMGNTDYAFNVLVNSDTSIALNKTALVSTRAKEQPAELSLRDRYGLLHEMAHAVVGVLNSEDRIGDHDVWHARHNESVLKKSEGVSDQYRFDIGMDFENRYVLPRGHLYSWNFLALREYAKLDFVST